MHCGLGPRGLVALWEASSWCLECKLGSENGCGGDGQGGIPHPFMSPSHRHCKGHSQGGEAAVTPRGFIFASSSHPDQKFLPVLGHMGPWLSSCPAAAWPITLGLLGIVSCWDDVGKGTV